MAHCTHALRNAASSLGAEDGISEEVQDDVEADTDEWCYRAGQHHENIGLIKHDTPRYSQSLSGAALPTLGGTRWGPSL
jgi:hypothetical protein